MPGCRQQGGGVDRFDPQAEGVGGCRRRRRRARRSGGGDPIERVERNDEVTRAAVATQARALSGAISEYNVTEKPYALRNVVLLVVRRARMQGFIYFDYRDKWPAMLKDLAAWRADGRISVPDDIVEGGVQAFPDTLLRLFRGENLGKLMIRIAD